MPPPAPRTPQYPLARRSRTAEVRREPVLSRRRGPAVARTAPTTSDPHRPGSADRPGRPARRCPASQGGGHPPFRNPDLPLSTRLDDLVSRLTLDEKVGLLHQFQPAIPRLGIEAFKTGTEALHGVAWLGQATVFPQADRPGEHLEPRSDQAGRHRRRRRGPGVQRAEPRVQRSQPVGPGGQPAARPALGTQRGGLLGGPATSPASSPPPTARV